MERYKRPCVMHLPSLPLGLDPLFRVRSYPVRHWQDSLYTYWCGTSISSKAPPLPLCHVSHPCDWSMSFNFTSLRCIYPLSVEDVRITATHLLENGLTLYHPHMTGRQLPTVRWDHSPYCWGISQGKEAI